MKKEYYIKLFCEHLHRVLVCINLFPEGTPIALTRFIPINDSLIEIAIVFVLKFDLL
jgi:hypothetical protein